jgi:hypothetical protein
MRQLTLSAHDASDELCGLQHWHHQREHLGMVAQEHTQFSLTGCNINQ